MPEPIMAHRMTERAGTEDPLESLRDAIAFSSADWSAARDLAWIYGIVLGWDGEDGEPGVWDELARQYGWPPAQVDRLRRLHEKFERLAAGSGQ